jgi:hypothetical protein
MSAAIAPPTVMIRVQADTGTYKPLGKKSRKIIKSSPSLVDPKYFSKDESRETLQRIKFDRKNKKTCYKTYKYANGAVY